jgi:hypothetical protein
MGFHGDLVDLPLQDVLQVISNYGKSGHLSLQTQSHDISLKFNYGSVASVTTSDGSLKIGHLLVSHGYVTEEQVERALGLQAMNPESARIGDVLIEVGYVTREQIQKAVNAQLEASIFRILIQPGGTFSFESADEVDADPITSGIRLEAMVLNALRLADEWGSVYDASMKIVLTDAVIDASIVNELSEREQALVMSVLNGDSTVDVIALRSGLNAREFAAAVKSLKQRGFIELAPLGELTRESSSPYTVVRY